MTRSWFALIFTCIALNLHLCQPTCVGLFSEDSPEGKEIKNNEGTLKQACRNLNVKEGFIRSKEFTSCMGRMMKVLKMDGFDEGKLLVLTSFIADIDIVEKEVAHRVSEENWDVDVLETTCLMLVVSIDHNKPRSRADILLRVITYAPPDWWAKFFQWPFKDSFSTHMGVLEMLDSRIAHLEIYHDWWLRAYVGQRERIGCSYNAVNNVSDFFSRRAAKRVRPTKVDEFETVYETLCWQPYSWATGQAASLFEDNYVIDLQAETIAYILRQTQNMDKHWLTSTWKEKDVWKSFTECKFVDEEEYDKKEKSQKDKITDKDGGKKKNDDEKKKDKQKGLNKEKYRKKKQEEKRIRIMLDVERQCVANRLKDIKSCCRLNLAPHHLTEFQQLVEAEGLDRDILSRVLEAASLELRWGVDGDLKPTIPLSSVNNFLVTGTRLIEEEEGVEEVAVAETTILSTLLKGKMHRWKLDDVTALINDLRKLNNLPFGEFDIFFDAVRTTVIDKIKKIQMLFYDLGIKVSWKKVHGLFPPLFVYEFCEYYELTEFDYDETKAKALRPYLGKGIKLYFESPMLKRVDYRIMLAIAEFDQSLPENEKLTKNEYEKLFVLVGWTSEAVVGENENQYILKAFKDGATPETRKSAKEMLAKLESSKHR